MLFSEKMDSNLNDELGEDWMSRLVLSDLQLDESGDPYKNISVDGEVRCRYSPEAVTRLRCQHGDEGVESLFEAILPYIVTPRADHMNLPTEELPVL